MGRAVAASLAARAAARMFTTRRFIGIATISINVMEMTIIGVIINLSRGVCRRRVQVAPPSCYRARMALPAISTGLMNDSGLIPSPAHDILGHLTHLRLPFLPIVSWLAGRVRRLGLVLNTKGGGGGRASMGRPGNVDVRTFTRPGPVVTVMLIAVSLLRIGAAVVVNNGNDAMIDGDVAEVALAAAWVRESLDATFASSD